MRHNVLPAYVGKDRFAVCLTAFFSAAACFAADTEISKWYGNAESALIVYYDDGCQSQLKNVIPALTEYKVPATFYLCCGWYESDASKLSQWISAHNENPEIVNIGNHTWSHGNAETAEKVREEVSKNDAKLRSAFKIPSEIVMSFAVPGGVKWPLGKGNAAKHVLDEFRLIKRPDTGIIAGVTHKDAKSLIQELDKASKSGGFSAVMFHGVGGDWLSMPADEHLNFVKEAAHRALSGSLWITTPVKLQMYSKARESLTVTSKQTDNEISVLLSAKSKESDNGPECNGVTLSLATKLPDDWSGATAQQDGKTLNVRISNGTAYYDVMPENGEILLVRKN